MSVASKGALGHWVAGAGAVGSSRVEAVVDGTVLPTAGLREPDPDCDVHHVIGARSPAESNRARQLVRLRRRERLPRAAGCA